MANLKELIFEYCDITGRPTQTLSVKEFLSFKDYVSEHTSGNSQKSSCPVPKPQISKNDTKSAASSQKTIEKKIELEVEATVPEDTNEDNKNKLLKMMQSIPC